MPVKTAIRRSTFSSVRRWTISRSWVVVGTPNSTAAVMPTTMNSTFAAQSSRSSVPVSETAGSDTVETKQRCEHLLRELDPLHWRACERDIDQRRVDVLFGRDQVRIELRDQLA